MKFFQKLPFTGSAPSLESIIETYLYSCEVEGKTVRTVQAYKKTLGQFLEVATAEGFSGNITKIKTPHVYAFFGWVKNRGVSAGTQHRRYRETRALFSWCIRMGRVEHNPFDGLPNVSREQTSNGFWHTATWIQSSVCVPGR